MGYNGDTRIISITSAVAPIGSDSGRLLTLLFDNLTVSVEVARPETLKRARLKFIRICAYVGNKFTPHME